jgi:putative copper export protein
MENDQMAGIVVMIINYFHDLAVGVLAAAVLIIYLLGKYMDEHPARDEILAKVIRRFSYLSYGALAYILIGGAARAYFFMDFEWNPAVGRGQVTALIIKHIALVILTVIGITMQIRYSKKYG